MELNWSTFVLEILNFLVLLWILKRFLYQPVLQMIARRQDAIQKSMLDAKKMQDDAQAAQQQYQNRLHDWQQEREQARTALQAEIAAERLRLLESLRVELEQEKEKTRVLAQKEQQEALIKLESAALAQGAQFATRLLQPFATPALESQLVEFALQQLTALNDEQRQAIGFAANADVNEIFVSSAFHLSDEYRQQLLMAIKGITGHAVPLQFTQDATLLAGLRITIGAWVLKANLRDELQAFAELSQHAG